MGRNRKPIGMIKAEGRSHMTKAQIAQREKAEQAWRTGWPVECTEEIKRDPVALAQFNRIMPYLTAMGVNDELFGNQIRRYCTTTSELKELWAFEDKCRKGAREHAGDKLGAMLDRQADKSGRLALKLCDELLAFEKEYGMTVMSSLKMRPLAPEKESNPIKDILYPDGNCPEGYNW